MVIQAYCVKCKSKRDMKDDKQITMKNGRQAITGICTTCGTKMFKIGGGSTKVAAKVKPTSKKPVKKATKTKTKSKRK
ncbi:MAG: DUF5679 domain-containing protein [Nitrososphaeraceae archaeon]